MHSREKISLVLRSRLPRRPRKTKGPDPNFAIGLLHVSVDLPSKYLNFMRCTFYNSCQIHGSREVAWERERILQTKQKLTSPSPNHSSTICFSSFSEFCIAYYFKIESFSLSVLNELFIFSVIFIKNWIRMPAILCSIVINVCRFKE